MEECLKRAIMLPEITSIPQCVQHLVHALAYLDTVVAFDPEAGLDVRRAAISLVEAIEQLDGEQSGQS
jgi:hypothetical protein